jgi:hypothetical protein
MQDLKEWLSIIISVVTLLIVLFGIYKYFRDPDIVTAENVRLVQQACTMRHANLDEHIANTDKILLLIQENHLPHIERDIGSLKESNVKIFTILEERLPKK